MPRSRHLRELRLVVGFMPVVAACALLMLPAVALPESFFNPFKKGTPRTSTSKAARQESEDPVPLVPRNSSKQAPLQWTTSSGDRLPVAAPAREGKSLGKQSASASNAGTANVSDRSSNVDVIGADDELIPATRAKPRPPISSVPRKSPIIRTGYEQDAIDQVVPRQPREPLEIPDDVNFFKQLAQSPPAPGLPAPRKTVEADSEPLPNGAGRPVNPIRIPLDELENPDNIQLSTRGDRVTLVVRNAPLSSVLNILAQQRGLNVVTSEGADAQISVTLTNVAFEDALSAIVSIAGCTWVREKDIILVSSVTAESRVAPQLQGRQVRVLPLNFVAANDVEVVVKGLLSPVGQIFVTQASPTDKRRTQELVVVEDLPPFLDRVADYIAQVDCPPRQVMIEAYVLQINLKDDTKHGVNLQYLLSAGGSDIALKTVGFASPAAVPAALFTVDGAHFDAVIEALKTTTDSKTLASPKVIVANGQQARIQIGARFGYFVTTTTQTSTLQNVNFLDTGVVLNVTPTISSDNQVLMHVTPEVSTGKINSAGLPETETTKADTTVLLPDGNGMVIGGLIKEQDIDTQEKVPLLGDIRVVGRLFQRRTTHRERVEIVIALIPRLVPFTPEYQQMQDVDVDRATSHVLVGPLKRAPRPWEPKLPDAMENPRHVRLGRLKDVKYSLRSPIPWPVDYYVPPASDDFPELFAPESLSIVPPPMTSTSPYFAPVPEVPPITQTSATSAMAPAKKPRR